MSPTLNPGNIVVVNKLLFGGRIFNDLHFNIDSNLPESWRLKGVRGVQWNDICVFNNPKHNSKISLKLNDVFCKRCIGLPGDSIWIKNGFYRNNNFVGSIGLEEEQNKWKELSDSRFPMPKLIGNKLGWNLREFGPLYIPRRGDVIDITHREVIIYKHLFQWETGKTVNWNTENNNATLGCEPFSRYTFKTIVR